MVRQISKEIYVVASILTGVIFLLGFFLGMVIEGKRIQYVETESKKQQLDLNSVQLQYSYIDQLSQQNNCEAVSKTFEKNIENLESTRIRLENFNQNAILGKSDFETLMREYSLAQIRYWLLAEKTKQLCNRDIVTVLYFFAEDKNCSDCNEEAFILTHMKKQFKDKLLIFSFRPELKHEPMIDLLANAHNVEKYPSIVIDDVTFSGFTEKDALLKHICSKYNSTPEPCKT